MDVKLYKLGGPEGRHVRLCQSVEEFNRSRTGFPPFVGREEVRGHLVSTVFTGQPWPKKNYSGDPLVFETIVFYGGVGAGRAVIVGHWSSWEQAEEQHHRTVLRVSREKKK